MPWWGWLLLAIGAWVFTMAVVIGMMRSADQGDRQIGGE
jgi:hypothetical protein